VSAVTRDDLVGVRQAGLRLATARQAVSAVDFPSMFFRVFRVFRGGKLRGLNGCERQPIDTFSRLCADCRKRARSRPVLRRPCEGGFRGENRPQAGFLRRSPSGISSTNECRDFCKETTQNIEPVGIRADLCGFVGKGSPSVGRRLGSRASIRSCPRMHTNEHEFRPPEN
jgi:hypothetical protein